MGKTLKVNAADVIIAGLSALAGLGALLHLPVWAIFIGWAWYIALGNKKSAIRDGGVTAVMAAVLALSAIVLTDALQSFMQPMAASMAAVFVAILLLMIFLKLPVFTSSLVAFNSFSCIFAGYYLQAFPVQESYFLSLLVAFVWITGANVLGLLLGHINATLIAWVQRGWKSSPETASE
ncbi:Protein of unknown function [Selenomonas sp. WCT3]|uniref:DUF1097 domain-containing protein n=1 Tax=Selenomonas sp. WCT3 TaxID=3158785 RepID=UPI00087FE3B4|nr:Protein of unknown function [Selenomonas ruminantium]